MPDVDAGIDHEVLLVGHAAQLIGPPAAGVGSAGAHARRSCGRAGPCRRVRLVGRRDEPAHRAAGPRRRRHAQGLAIDCADCGSLPTGQVTFHVTNDGPSTHNLTVGQGGTMLNTTQNFPKGQQRDVTVDLHRELHPVLLRARARSAGDEARRHGRLLGLRLEDRLDAPAAEVLGHGEPRVVVSGGQRQIQRVVPADDAQEPVVARKVSSSPVYSSRPLRNTATRSLNPRPRRATRSAADRSVHRANTVFLPSRSASRAGRPARPAPGRAGQLRAARSSGPSVRRPGDRPLANASDTSQLSTTPGGGSGSGGGSVISATSRVRLDGQVRVVRDPTAVEQPMPPGRCACSSWSTISAGVSMSETNTSARTPDTAIRRCSHSSVGKAIADV